jgi:branched-chain amino acid transport system ATP-binding protein
VLTLESVTKRFGGLTAVRAVSLEVRAGDLLGIIGPNGAGKTTLFNVIAGYYRPEEGRVRFDGRDVTGLPPHAIARLGLTRTFQIVKPFGNLSVADNVMIGALTRLPRVADARAEAGRVTELCGLGPHRHARARALPIALRKRLEVARALATHPRLLLLDEVMAGLNPTEISEIVEVIREVRTAGVTILLIEHVMQAVTSLAERVYVLNQGRMIAEGTPAAIAENPEVVEAYLGHGAAKVLRA